jgi:hypothetical protein
MNSTNRSNNSTPQQPKKTDQVEHLIHPKLVGRFIPRKSSASAATAGAGTGTGSLIPRKNSTGTGSGSLIHKSLSECVPATISQDFSTTTKQSTIAGVASSKLHAYGNASNTSTSTGCHDRSEHQYHYHQAHAPPLSEGGMTPLTEASTASGSVSGGGAFGSVESMSTSTSTTNRWLHPHEPPVKEIPMVVCQSQTKPTAAETATNNRSNSSDDTIKGRKKRRDDSLGTNESTVSTNSDDHHQQQERSQQLLLKLQQIQVGSRVAVYWDGDDEFFPGTVTKERNALTHRKRFFLKYDDGDREWIDFSRHKFRVLKDKKEETVVDDATYNENNDDDGDSTRQSEEKGRRKSKKNAKGKSATVHQNFRVNDNDIDRSCSSDGKRKTKTNAVDKSSTAFTFETNSVVVGNGKQNAQVSNDDDKAERKSATVHKGESNLFVGNVDDNWVASGFQRSADDSSDESETDEEEIMLWAEKMFGVTPQRPIARTKAKVEPEFNWDDYADVHIPISEAVKMGRRRNRDQASTETSAPKTKRCKIADVNATTEKARIDAEEEENKRKKQEKRALTADEIRSILGEDSRACDEATHWVRRSVRQPSKSIVNSPQVKALFEKLRMNDTDMVVLKMKKYLNDPNTPSVALDAVLDVLEENTNCEALYIQVRPRNQLALQIRFAPHRVLIFPFFLPFVLPSRILTKECVTNKSCTCLKCCSDRLAKFGALTSARHTRLNRRRGESLPTGYGTQRLPTCMHQSIPSTLNSRIVFGLQFEAIVRNTLCTSTLITLIRLFSARTVGGIQLTPRHSVLI